MESLDNIIEEINKFDISIVNIDNVNQIFKKLDSIISICEDKILSCANKIDNEDSNVTPQEKHLPEDFSSIFNFDLQFGQVSMLAPPVFIGNIITKTSTKFNA